jgi:hypothetical protein
MTGFYLDTDGAAAPPRSNGEVVFDHPWQRRLFATTMALCQADVISYDRFRRQLIQTIDTGSSPYWSSWQDALEMLLADDGLCDQNELGARAAEFRAHSSPSR